MAEEQVLKAPVLSEPFIVTMDASDVALGAILSQGKIGADHGEKLVTDHEPLKHFHTSIKPDLRFNRLKAALNGYDFDVVYRQGIKNANADALSRNPVLAEGETNPDLPRHELYELADRQVRENPDKEAGATPGRVFRARTVKKQGQNAGEKERVSASSSADSSNRGKKSAFNGLRKPKNKNTFMHDYRDATWFDCILTNTSLKRLDKNHYLLSASERTRIDTILREAIQFCANAPARSLRSCQQLQPNFRTPTNP